MAELSSPASAVSSVSAALPRAVERLTFAELAASRAVESEATVEAAEEISV